MLEIMRFQRELIVIKPQIYYIFLIETLFIFIKIFCYVYNKPIGDKEPYFEFDVLTNRNHDYVLSDKTQSPFNDSREFADRTYCEKMVMEQFAKQLQMENEYDENISKK